MIKTQISRVARPIADLSIENARPNRQVLLDVDRAQYHVSHTADSRVPAGKISPARIERPHDQFDAVATEVGEGDHVLDLAQGAILCRSSAGGESKPPQAFKRRVEIIRMAHFQTDRLHRVVPARKSKRVISKIGAEGRQLPRPVDRLESEHALTEIRCTAEITGNKADIAQLLKCDHQALMRCISWAIGRLRIGPAAAALVVAPRRVPTECPSRC